MVAQRMLQWVVEWKRRKKEKEWRLFRRLAGSPSKLLEEVNRLL
jgi:hypothetical protein